MFQGISRFSFPTPIIFGPGSVREIPGSLKELDAKKTLLVTDGMMVQTPTFKRVSEVLDGEKVLYAVYSEVQGNPHDTDVEGAARTYIKEGCDSILALGGGSPMDVAKALAVIVSGGGDIGDYDIQSPAPKRVEGVLPPIIAVPTTAGTGSEVGKCAVITSTKTGRKFLVCNPMMMPKRAVLDPDLTVTLPAHLTAATGMDALTHNIESLTAPIFHPMCDAIALKGIEFAVKYLEKAVKEPGNIEARGYMMLSAMMGAVAFQKDLGAAHSLSHALSAVCGLQHGLANAVCLPHVMNFNKDVCSREYTLVAGAFGVETYRMSEKEAASEAVSEVRQLNGRIGIPAGLKDIKIHGSQAVMEKQLPEIAEKAYKDPCHQTNARVCTKEDLLNLLKEAY